MKLIECVPNFSEGRDEEILDSIGSAMVATPGCWLLDRTADLDHARSVFTLVGYPEAVIAAVDPAVALAIEHIDLLDRSRPRSVD